MKFINNLFGFLLAAMLTAGAAVAEENKAKADEAAPQAGDYEMSKEMAGDDREAMRKLQEERREMMQKMSEEDREAMKKRLEERRKMMMEMSEKEREMMRQRMLKRHEKMKSMSEEERKAMRVNGESVEVGRGLLTHHPFDGRARLPLH